MGCSAGRGAEGAGRGAERPACAAGRPFRRGRGAAADGERGACSRRGAGHRGRHRARAGHRRAAEVAGGGRPVRAPVAGRVRARRRRRPARRSALLRPCPGPPGCRPARAPRRPGQQDRGPPRPPSGSCAVPARAPRWYKGLRARAGSMRSWMCSGSTCSRCGGAWSRTSAPRAAACCMHTCWCAAPGALGALALAAQHPAAARRLLGRLRVCGLQRSCYRLGGFRGWLQSQLCQTLERGSWGQRLSWRRWHQASAPGAVRTAAGLGDRAGGRSRGPGGRALAGRRLAPAGVGCFDSVRPRPGLRRAARPIWLARAPCCMGAGGGAGHGRTCRGAVPAAAAPGRLTAWSARVAGGWSTRSRHPKCSGTRARSRTRTRCACTGASLAGTPRSCTLTRCGAPGTGAPAASRRAGPLRTGAGLGSGVSCRGGAVARRPMVRAGGRCDAGARDGHGGRCGCGGRPAGAAAGGRRAACVAGAAL